MPLPKILIIFVIISTVTITTCGSDASSDRLALLSFKSFLSDPSSTLRSWTNTTHPCRFRGITCNQFRRVSSLHLDFLNLTGRLSPSLSNLSSLTHLHLAGNLLSGHLPLQFSLLPRLRYLNLSSNSLSGEIPLLPSTLQNISLNYNSFTGTIPATLSLSPNLTVICFDRNELSGNIPATLSSLNLSWLYLAKNNLTGNIPSWLTTTTNLRRLDLSGNFFSGKIPILSNLSSLALLDLSQNYLVGPIPPSLSNCSVIVYLDLSQNILVGNIPDSFSSFPSLRTLDLSFNGLVGRVPASLYNLSSLRFLSLGMNQLIGKLPTDLGRSRLSTLILQGNQFDGPIPNSITNVSGLQLLDLSQNSLIGGIPANLGQLSGLYQLNLGWNSLETDVNWSFLTSLTNCSELSYLIVCSNNLEGVLPTGVGNLSTQLEWLVMGENQIHGSIPAGVAKLESLTMLELDHNQLTGTIPTAIGSLEALQVLDLSANELSGDIPTNIGNLTQLNELHLGENRLLGSIPTRLGECVDLELLNLSHNRLGGAIPREVVSISRLTKALDFSHNSLSGKIPLEVRKLVNLALLDVSYNRFSGEIPRSLGDCDVLESLYLDHNLLTGSIPSQLSNLRGIQNLDLSHNNLSGIIPQYLTTLTSLHYLNLSLNNFEGEVPSVGIFANVTTFSVSGNSELCGGIPKLQLPVCYKASKRHPRFILLIIIPVSAVLLLSLFLAVIYWKRKNGKINMSSTSMEFSDDQYRKVTYSELRKATNEFAPSNLIGAGSFGSVYKGKLACYKKDIAVKVLDLEQRGALEGFVAECEALRHVRHRSLVRILTTCATIDGEGNEFRALVYHLMGNGSLEEWLHPSDGLRGLSFAQMLEVVIDVGCALDYLHDHGEEAIVHCDLKPSNVLLDDDMKARVSDFGLARFINGDNSLSTTIAVKGSIGYVAPEYGMGGKISTQGDVYSYGILVLEMLTGKRPTDEMFKEGLMLRNYVETAIPERVMEIADPRLTLSNEADKKSNQKEMMKECMVSMIRVALMCSIESPNARTSMRNAVSELNGIRTAYLGLGNPVLVQSG